MDVRVRQAMCLRFEFADERVHELAQVVLAPTWTASPSPSQVASCLKLSTGVFDADDKAKMSSAMCARLFACVRLTSSVCQPINYIHIHIHIQIVAGRVSGVPAEVQYFLFAYLDARSQSKMA